MKYLKSNKKKKNNSIIRAKTSAVTTTLFTLATIISIILAGAPTLFEQQAEAGLFDFGHLRNAPAVISGDNIYIAWQSNNTANGNEDIFFRASNDGGATFSDKMNLSNTTNADSSRVEIAAEGADVIVTWWETNQTSDTPVARMSEDGGATFGPLLRLGANGTISATEEEEGGGTEGGETVEEEAVGGAAVAE